MRKHPFLRYYKNGSHPTGEERKGYYQSLLNDSENGKSNFLIDSITFQNYKRIATVESIENALMQGALVQALETSFRAHLNKPSSPLFYYYIMESLRRDAVLNGASWNRDFLTYLYFEKGDKTQLSEGKKDSYNKGIFEVYDEEVIGISEDEFAKIEGNFYFKSGTYFRTNEQAFDFFFKMSQFYNCDECILSNAMSLYDSDKQQSLELINKYLQTPDPKRKMLAEALLNGDLNEGFPNKTLVVFPQQELKLIRGNNTINFYAPSFVQTTLDSVSKSFGNNFENRDVLLMKDQLEDQTTQSLLEWMHYLARYVKMSGDRNINLVFLNPDFYDLMKNLGYSSFEFVDLAFYQHVSNGNLKNVDDYASIKTALSSSLLSDEFAQFANIYISEIKDQLLLVDYARVDYQREEYSLNNEDSKLIAYKTLLTEAMLQKSNQKPRDTPYLIRKIAK